MSDPLFALRDFVVGVGARPLLGPIALSLRGGEMLALTGPSGCGKTTLLRAAAGLIDPLRGQAALEGQTATQIGWPAYRRRVLLVNQQPVLLDASVRDNLLLPFQYHSANGRAFDEPRAAELLARLRLTDLSMQQDARRLSVGEQQRVCLVRALLMEPSVLLMDEPTSALDESAVSIAEQLVREQVDKARGDRPMAAVVVTHNTQQAQRWCDRRMDLMAPGRGGDETP